MPQNKNNYQNKLKNKLLSEIRGLCADEKLTQEKIGKLLGVKQSAVSSLLNGKSSLSMSQYFALCELLGESPSQLMQKAQSSSRENFTLTPHMEQVLYKSDLHLICYCAAIREMSPQDIQIGGVSQEDIESILDELCQVKLVEKNKKNLYVQKHPDRSYVSPTRYRNSQVHQKLVSRSWRYFDRMHENKAFISNKFNAYCLDRFSAQQIKEIEASLWKVFQRIQSIRQGNLGNAYQDDASMPLWNIHLMLTTPCDLKK